MDQKPITSPTPPPTVIEPSIASTSPSRFNPKIIIMAGAAGVLLVIVIAFFAFMQKGATNQTGIPNAPTTTPLVTKSTQVAAPKTAFKNYTGAPSLNTTASELPTYKLKQKLTIQEAQSLARVFNTTQTGDVQNSMVVFSNTASPTSKGVLLVDMKTGAFSYESFGVFKPGTSPVSSAQSVLQTTGLQDGTILCNVTYKLAKVEDLTFVECHRDWKKLGGPLVTLPGVLNMGETNTLTNTNAGWVTQDSPKNAEIVNVSTGQNGYARPNDFNTITFTTTANGEITKIKSNVRWTQPNGISKATIVPYARALDAFKKGLARYSLTLPTGVGTPDWNMVYPQNIASAPTATIDDASLVYLEGSPTTSVSEYVPYYLIRGTAMLDSGYTVAFAQAIPAIPDANGRISDTDDEGLQLRTFEPPTSTPTIPQPTTAQPTTVQPTATLPPEQTTSPEVCIDPDTDQSTSKRSAGNKTISLSVPGYGSIEIYHSGDHTYFYSQNPDSPQNIDSVKDIFFQAAAEQAKKNFAIFIINNPTVAVPTTPGASSMAEKAATDLKLTNEPLYEHLTKNVVPVLGAMNGSAPTVSRIKQVHTAIDTTFYPIIKDKTKINAIASGPDLFPPETIRGFYKVFVYEKGSSGNSCYITGRSPFVFLYPEVTQKVTVTTNANLTYADPIPTKNTWNTVARPNGTITSNGVTRGGIYYEYNDENVKFSNPNTGFVIKSSELDSFIKSLGEKLALTTVEATRLKQEVVNALSKGANSKYVVVSLASREEIEKNLPLTFEPNPESINRIMLIVSPKNEKLSLPTPSITPVVRSGFTVVELGAYQRK